MHEFAQLERGKRHPTLRQIRRPLTRAQVRRGFQNDEIALRQGGHRQLRGGLCDRKPYSRQKRRTSQSVSRPAQRSTIGSANFFPGTGKPHAREKNAARRDPLASAQSARLGGRFRITRIREDRLLDELLRRLLKKYPQIGMQLGKLLPHHRIEKKLRRAHHNRRALLTQVTERTHPVAAALTCP
nr:hypothetical protein [Methylocystis sp.]